MRRALRTPTLALVLAAAGPAVCATPPNPARTAMTAPAPPIAPLSTPGVSVQDVTLPHGVAPWRAEPTRLSADDQLEILGLTSRFNWAVDTRHFDALPEMFVDGAAVFDHQWGYRTTGAAAEQLVRANEPNEKAVRHQNANHVLTANADGTVTMVSYLIAVRVDGAPEQAHAPYVIAHGVNTHVVRRDGGRWRIAAMTLDQTAVNSAALPDPAARGHDAATASVRARLDGRAP
jgi:ketosteroid isomerase-like protein